MTGTRMVRVATTRDGFEARILAARLGAEGIVWELQGNVDGPYPVGVVHVLVEEGAADAARELLTLEPEELVDDDDDPAVEPWRGSVIAAVALLAAALMGLARVLTLI